MKSERNGIIIAGNIITDIVKIIDEYPERTMLANITSIERAVGGCAPNTAINLAKLDNTMPIKVMGRVGDDENGDYVIDKMKSFGIDVSGVKKTENTSTSFSDVMNENVGGMRTFFHHRGANASFDIGDILSEDLNCRIFHIGYLLLLDCFDKEDAEYGTVMARLLSELQMRGIKTSIDAVSDQTKDFRAIIMPALKYCNYVIMNETECGSACGLQVRGSDGRLNIGNIRKCMLEFMEHGVRDKVIVHSPEMGICLNSDGGFTLVPSLKLPYGYIKGSVGAGDTYAAAVLYGIYNGLDDKTILETASCAAACNLSEVNSIDGMKSIDEVRMMNNEFERIDLGELL